MLIGQVFGGSSTNFTTHHILKRSQTLGASCHGRLKVVDSRHESCTWAFGQGYGSWMWSVKVATARTLSCGLMHSMYWLIFYPSRCQESAPKAPDDYLGGLIHDLQLDTAGLKSFEQMHLFRKIVVLAVRRFAGICSFPCYLQKRDGSEVGGLKWDHMRKCCQALKKKRDWNELGSSLSICRLLVTYYT